MERNINNMMKGVVGLATASLLWSCAAETPWEEEGTGTVLLHTTINAMTTRAVDGYTDQQLADNCVVYISRKNGTTTGDSKTKDGLVYKETGLSNVEDKITLNAGHYAAEAFTGDSTAASFTDKYFRGYQDFDVSKNGLTSVSLICKIQNTVVMVDNSNLDDIPMENYTVTVSNGDGTLDFKVSDGSIANKGYFMMPIDDSGTLTYVISGTKKLDNTTFTHTGTIENVKRTTAYVLKFAYNPTPNDPMGGASFINIEVDETEVDGGTENETIPASAPGITGVGFDIDQPLNYSREDEIPTEIAIKVCAVGGITSLTINNDDPASINGITVEDQGTDAETNVCTKFIVISKSYIVNLPSGETTLEITAKDNFKESTATLTIKR